VKWAVLCVVAFLASGCMTGQIHQKIRVEEGWVRVGMTEGEVRQTLGEPDQIYVGPRAPIATPYSLAHHAPLASGCTKWVYEQRRPVVAIIFEHGEVLWLTTWQ